MAFEMREEFVNPFFFSCVRKKLLHVSPTLFLEPITTPSVFPSGCGMVEASTINVAVKCPPEEVVDVIYEIECIFIPTLTARLIITILIIKNK